MRLFGRALTAAGLLMALGSSAPALAGGRSGSLVGWVEDSQGEPIAGALVSLFGRGIEGGSVIAFSDAGGRFLLPSVPAGSYTLRAVDKLHQPAAAQQVTLLPDQDAVFSFSLAPLLAQLSPAEEAERTRELKWLLRHKRRSALEDEGDEIVEARSALPARPALPELSGDVEVMTAPGALGLPGTASPASLGQASSWSVLHLSGRFADSGQWQMSGLVTSADSTNWRMSGEFSVTPWLGHEIRGGSAYGAGLPHPAYPGDVRMDPGTVSAAFVEDRWRIDERFAASLGARYSYLGYLVDRNHFDPSATLEFDPGVTRVRGSFTTSTLAPGGDLTRISAEAPAAALAFAVMDSMLRPEHIARLELGADRPVGPVVVGLRSFHEAVSDPLVNTFGRGPASLRSLNITNGSDQNADGIGLSVGRHFGCVSGSVTYTYGHASHAAGVDPALPAMRAGDFHDITTHLAAVFAQSGTRVVAVYRVNTLSARAPQATAFSAARYDVEVRQGLPFLGSLTRADWELLVAIRNLLYADEEGGVLDEVAVLAPPKRVLGGIAIRF